MAHTDKLADYTTDRRVIPLSLIAVAIGALASVIALALLDLIQFFTNLCFYGKWSFGAVSPAQHHLGPWVILIPAAGGLVIGFMARYGSDKIRGHGIPEALEAILIGRSQMEPKVAVLKPLSSAISIGTGGPFGAEGPIIMTGGAVGSLIAQFIHLSAAERKTLLVAGASAGMAAVFATPMAAVLLAVELLLFEWKPRSFIPVAMASITAAILRVPLLGSGPIFFVSPHAALNLPGMSWALVLGLVAGLASTVLTGMVYLFEDLFTKLPIHWMWWPTIGGLFVGIGGYIDPRVLGVGYDVIHSLLNGQILGVALIGLILGKSIVWSLSLGSGTSGGVLAPLLMMGGALGALMAQVIPMGSASLWAIVGMAAMMGGTMRSPFTAVVFTLELTHDLNILPGLLVACVAAEGVTVLLLKRSILTEKVARRGHHLIREYSIDPLDVHRVREVMMYDFPTVLKTTTVDELFTSMSNAESTLVRRQGAPVVDGAGKLFGIITQSDVMRAIHEGRGSDPVSEVCSTALVVTHKDELLREVVSSMLRHDIGRLPVVDEDDTTKLVGYLDRSHIFTGRKKWYEEENHREHRWEVPGTRSRTSTIQ
jgi:H+/Cl- antiporter ClcA